MIPAVIHFIWVSLGETLNSLQEMGILSAVLNTNCKVILHTDDTSICLPGVETRYREFPTKINGVDFNKDENVNHVWGKRVSHLKDVVRLQILYEEGGIYSDIDVLWLRHPWRFLEEKVVIGFQNKSYHTLCNAVMMAEPKNEAIKKYLDWTISIYPPKKYWIPANPYKLWKDNPDICMVDKYHFFPLPWSKKIEHSFTRLEKATAVHLYQSGGLVIEGDVIDVLRERIKRLKAQ
jgi:hypothetical protein